MSGHSWILFSMTRLGGAAGHVGVRNSQFGQTLIGRALFIEPKWAQFLQSSGVTSALGRPMPQPSKSPAALDGATERII